ncbi:AAA domain-containing protein [Azotobacter beijerinckii]|uniref:AAA domain-containing protein n=1 Tax=Azotobacter beijerinckii TaxID=170623 RepID=A0A1H7ALG6_9GAMM|nr:AAA family ATPase [Azotobacter beijerinckii]SEJ66439.1 AAA domain-containing protein [Azotobacter beijerinckii]
MSDLLKHLLPRLEGVKQYGESYMARCPAHQDTSPSLSLSRGNDGRVLVHCYAGCETRDVLAAIGLELKDLFPSALSQEQRQQYLRKKLEKERHFEHQVIGAGNGTIANGKDLSDDDIARMALAQEQIELLDQQPAALEKPEKPKWRAVLTQASSIKPRAIRWLWPAWIAKGKLTVLAGAGGAGKTTLAIGLAATITSGGRWPDGGIYTERGNALIWTSEDDSADTLVPRLMAAGADLSRVHIINGRINHEGEREPFDPATDFDLLREAVEALGGASLLILDPVVNLVKGDMHKANDVRRSLQVVVDFAEEHDCAVLGISHFSKGSGGSSPADRVIGSQAFGALARTVLVAAKQEDSEVRVLARAKSNISNDNGGCSYSIEECTVDDGIETTRVRWGDFIEGSAKEILADVERQIDDEPEDDDPAEALRRILSEGPLTGKEAKQLMVENGYTQKQIRTAREKLSVTTTREGFGKDIKSYWSLPSFMPSKPHSCPSSSVGTNGEKGHEWKNEARMEGAADSQKLSKTASTITDSLQDETPLGNSLTTINDNAEYF